MSGPQNSASQMKNGKKNHINFEKNCNKIEIFIALPLLGDGNEASVLLLFAAEIVSSRTKTLFSKPNIIFLI